ncbi:MAG: hypothetical protein CM15mV49_870 [uncultured marine virus]|nr:MAG: hypothetical protein CM15mV49_870 [uncultured marine virus]
MKYPMFFKSPSKNETEYYFSEGEKIKAEKFIAKHNNLFLLQILVPHITLIISFKKHIPTQAQQIVNF